MHFLALVLKNDLSEITRLLNFIEQLGKEEGFSAEVINAMMLSLDEAVTNIINYGFPGGGNHPISLVLQREPQSIVAVLEDDGIPFNPLEAPEADLSSPIEERPIGGLGIHFIRSFMDELSYKRQGDKNIFTLTKRIT